MIWKVCGMRDARNIREVEALGVHWMGFIFYPRSKRYVSERPEYLPEQARRVGVFVDATSHFILEHVRDYGLQLVQLHGHETPEFCCQLAKVLGPGVQLIKAFQVSEASDLEACSAYEDCGVSYFLFDTRTEGYGGSGQSFDWSLLQHYQGSIPFLLSGGIGLESLDALQLLEHPRWCGVDLNSKFEVAPALKDVEKLRRFALQAKGKVG